MLVRIHHVGVDGVAQGFLKPCVSPHPGCCSGVCRAPPGLSWCVVMWPMPLLLNLALNPQLSFVKHVRGLSPRS